ncbi:MAG: hypothetical protein DLM70_16425 [Chloroflexi bacterium]|nr:MAG: hypothetical protein DLM70_16425 [Chloroflexota bacterium]
MPARGARHRARHHGGAGGTSQHERTCSFSAPASGDGGQPRRLFLKREEISRRHNGMTQLLLTQVQRNNIGGQNQAIIGV